MKQPKVYVKSYDKIFDVKEIHFDINIVYFDDGISGEYVILDFDEVEFIYGTGIIDKNGKEIEHGDILKTEFEDIFSIKFHDFYGFCAVDEDETYYFAEELEHELRELFSKAEVIGNIYENKDLLEE